MTDGLTRHRTVAPIAPLRESESPRRVANDGIREFLAFRIATEAYALPLAAVREILKPPPMTEVPRARSEVLGIISVRGRITTVFDLRRKLSMPATELDKHARVLLVDDGEEVLGLLVDRVLQVYRLSEDEVELASAVGGEMSEHVLGVGRPKGNRAVGRTRVEARADLLTDEILILLDPGPLLRR